MGKITLPEWADYRLKRVSLLLCLTIVTFSSAQRLDFLFIGVLFS